MFNDSQAIFHQLAAEEPAAVKLVIENHDAWLNAERVEHAVALAARLQQARLAQDPTRAARIEAQKSRLQKLVARLPQRRVATA